MRILLIFFLVKTVFGDINEDFLKANQGFSASVYKKFAKQTEGNFLLSPFSAEAILALTQSGCRGQTAEELRSLLNFTNDPSNIEAIFRNLLPSLGSDKLYKISTANKIYVKHNFLLKPEFKEIAAEVFGADSENIDFNQKQEAAETMNRWVKKQTNNKIQNLIDSSNLNNRTRAALINALYFKANWSRSFLVAYTKKLDFHLNPNKVVLVDMMLLHDKPFNYFESSNLRAKFLELPFKGNEASMVIALPDEIDGLNLLETQIRKVVKPHKFTSRSVYLGLPKFKIETSADFKTILKNMGVSRIFDNRYADLSGIAGNPGDLIIDKISQKSFIDVNEEGVEAASATYMLVAIPMSAPSETPVKFRVNRPFIFYIKVRGVIIFIGRVVDPRE